LDAPNLLDTVLEPRGRSRLFLEDDPPISVEDGPPTSVEYDASMPSVTKWTPSASAVFVFLFLVLAGVGGALAWRYYDGQATDMIGAPALPGATNKPTAPPEGFAELQQQLKSIATDLAAVRHTLEQQSAANHDQLTRIQEQIAQQSIALLSSSSLADKPVHTPLPKPAQHPAHVSTQDSSKPVQRAPPQSLLPPKQ
jgi:nitrogen fixation/metabolism regulation signal transduction histidine kinase